MRISHCRIVSENLVYGTMNRNFPFQYGPVIKLPLHISQCHMVNHMALTNPQWLQFWCNIFTSFLVNLLLDPIGMLIPWLKKILDHKSKTFKSWDYLNVLKHYLGLDWLVTALYSFTNSSYRTRFSCFDTILSSMLNFAASLIKTFRLIFPLALS